MVWIFVTGYLEDISRVLNTVSARSDPTAVPDDRDRPFRPVWRAKVELDNVFIEDGRSHSVDKNRSVRLMTFFESYLERLVFLISAALVFIPLERFLPRIKRQGWKRDNLRLDVTYMLLGSVATMLLSVMFISVAAKLLNPFIPQSALAFVRSQGVLTQALMLIVFGDLFYYWAHRLFHSVPFLWKFHSIHHSIEDMDWIAAHRTHPIDTAITNSGIFLIALLFDFGPLAILIFSAQFSWHSLLKHSNVSVGWGPLRWLYLTPTFHHWHHANVAEAYDKNFAGQLPLWDLLFGTAIMKQDEGPARYGVDDPVPKTFLGSLIYPFRSQVLGQEKPSDTDPFLPANAIPDSISR